MPKYLNEWNSLDTVGTKGKGMTPKRDYAHSIAINLHYYASIISLVITLTTLFFSFVVI